MSVNKFEIIKYLQFMTLVRFALPFRVQIVTDITASFMRASVSIHRCLVFVYLAADITFVVA